MTEDRGKQSGVAVFSGEGTREVVRAVRDLGAFVGDLAGAIVGAAEDRVQAWRARNLQALRDRLVAENASRRAAGQAEIPLRFALPALERAAEEDRPEMLELWAALLANVGDPERQIDPHRIFVHLLSEMEPLDVAVLRWAASELSAAPERPADIHVTIERVAGAFSAPAERVLLSLGNLARQGCFRAEEPDMLLTEGPRRAFLKIVTVEGSFTLAPLGRGLIWPTL